MPTIARRLAPLLERHLTRGKSILLLGPRQTGKTTLLASVRADLRLSFVDPAVRQRYERNPGLLAAEVAALPRTRGRVPRIVLDEVQKVPALMDAVQGLIDGKRGQFVLCGSSARKLRRGDANLLPGRVVTLHLDPLTVDELNRPDLDALLRYGSLPAIWTTPSDADRETDLASYVSGYLEEEVRAEALVRSVGSFARFLELAALESGGIVTFRELAQHIGVVHTTISSYYEILEDCLVAERVDPLTRSRTRRKLTRSSRWILFDLGVRRLAANEGRRLTPDRLGQLFEQMIGLELIRRTRRDLPGSRVHFWRVPQGPQVDWVVAREGALVPIETKWSEAPGLRDAHHLDLFLDEYREAETAYVVCRAPRRFRITDRIIALPWQDLGEVLR